MKSNLIDIRDVNINAGLPIKDKINSFIKQINDPYHFKCGDIEVTLNFIGSDSLENKIIKHLSSK